MTTLVPSSMLNQDGGLTSSALASNSITTAKIVDANVTAAKLASGAALANLAAASLGPSLLSQPLTQGTVQATTSGTEKDFAIPAWARRIRAMLQGVSLSGAALLRFRLGVSGGIVTSGYLGAGSVIAAVVATLNQTAGWDIYNSAPAGADIYTGSLEITQLDATNNIWVASGVFAQTSSARTYTVSGQVTLASALTTLRLTTSNGTDTFDAGSVNIIYD